MSIESRWTIGAIASKKASASAPVAAPIDSASAIAVSGPVATMVEAGGGEGVDPLAHELDIGMRGEPLGHRGGEAVAVDRQRRAGRHPVRVGGGHDQRAQRAHLGVEQADRIVLGIVGAEAVRADQLGEAVGVMGRRRLAASRAFRERRTFTPASASCQAASDPARPPPMIWTW